LAFSSQAGQQVGLISKNINVKNYCLLPCSQKTIPESLNYKNMPKKVSFADSIKFQKQSSVP